MAGGREPFAVAVEAALGHVHVEWSGDGRHGASAAGVEVGDGLPGAVHVVGVDVGDGLVGGAAAAEHRGHVDLFEQVGQRVVGVHGDQEHPVDAVCGEVVGEAFPLFGRTDEGEQQLHVGIGEFGADAADHVGEVGLGEEPCLGFGDDERDGVGAARREGAGRAVRYVSELGDGLLDEGAGAFADPWRAVDDA